LKILLKPPGERSARTELMRFRAECSFLFVEC
jgi:hypothetical protein